MFKYSALIKEYGIAHVQKPQFSINRELSIEELRDVFSVNEPYVQYYEIYQENENGIEIKIDFSY